MARITDGSCLCVGAILCPTDAVAVKAITNGRSITEGFYDNFRGESLLNDAAGIISFKIAVAALITGGFSMINAVEQFLISSIGGFVVGLIIGVALVRFRVTLSRRGIENINMFTFIQLVTPFVTYIVAEMFHASGIIAVIAGLVHGFERDRIAQARTRLQMSYNHTWNILGYALNGFVFSILGYLIPEVVGRIIENEPHNLIFLIVVTCLIALAIYLFRFLWVLFYIRILLASEPIPENDFV